MTDQLTEELQIAMDALEAQMDPDDSEIQAYARACNRVQGDEDATTARYKLEREKLDANYAKMLSGFENHRKGIEWKWGQMIREKINAKIIGEGLDTLAELETLGSLGISFGQGWLFGKPHPLRSDT